MSSAEIFPEYLSVQKKEEYLIEWLRGAVLDYVEDGEYPSGSVIYLYK